MSHTAESSPRRPAAAAPWRPRREDGRSPNMQTSLKRGTCRSCADDLSSKQYTREREHEATLCSLHMQSGIYVTYHPVTSDCP